MVDGMRAFAWDLGGILCRTVRQHCHKDAQSLSWPNNDDATTGRARLMLFHHFEVIGVLVDIGAVLQMLVAGNQQSNIDVSATL